MADERAIRAAELAKVEAVVDEHGTEREQVSLLLSGVMRSGVTLVQLAEAAATGQSIGRFPPDPELLAKLTRRVERWARLKLPKAECAADPPTPYCDCLERALDEPGDEGKRAVLALARRFHRRKTVEPQPTPRPQEVATEPQETNGHAEDPLPQPEPEPERKARPEPSVRVVHRTPKWFDSTPQSFRDMKF